MATLRNIRTRATHTLATPVRRPGRGRTCRLLTSASTSVRPPARRSTHGRPAAQAAPAADGPTPAAGRASVRLSRGARRRAAAAAPPQPIAAAARADVASPPSVRGSAPNFSAAGAGCRDRRGGRGGGAGGGVPKLAETRESDPHRLQQRQKQIDYGKNTCGYDRYTKLVPKFRRARGDPRTPDIHGVYSKRQWEGLVKAWRRRLHTYDPAEYKDGIEAIEAGAAAAGGATDAAGRRTRRRRARQRAGRAVLRRPLVGRRTTQPPPLPRSRRRLRGPPALTADRRRARRARGERARACAAPTADEFGDEPLAAAPLYARAPPPARPTMAASVSSWIAMPRGMPSAARRRAMTPA